jgi:hypothetical protein
MGWPSKTNQEAGTFWGIGEDWHNIGALLDHSELRKSVKIFSGNASKNPGPNPGPTTACLFRQRAVATFQQCHMVPAGNAKNHPLHV